jgi:hypothetical protein
VVQVNYLVLKDQVVNGADWRARVESDTALQNSSVFGMYGQEHLRLLGPDTLRPAVARIQAPLPAERGEWARRQATKKLRYITDARTGWYEEPRGTEEEFSNLYVVYLDYGLLCLTEDHSYCSGNSACHHSFSNTVYDLHTGNALALDDIVQPGAMGALRRMLPRYLRTDDLFSTGVGFRSADESEPMPLPYNDEFGLVDEGFVFKYSDRELDGFRWGPEITLPWAELQPLLRPDTPVARMLRERGLWRPKQ